MAFLCSMVLFFMLFWGYHNHTLSIHYDNVSYPDYETGSGQDYFHYNIDTAGPTVKFSFMFQ